MLNNINCRFSPDIGQLNLRDAGDGRASSALRDEVCSACPHFSCINLKETEVFGLYILKLICTS